MIKIKYFLNNVDQCWTCNNCVGSRLLPNLNRHINGMIEYDEGDSGLILLPECKVTDCYMFGVYERNCPYHEVKKDE